jgi:hypothetical protein
MIAIVIVVLFTGAAFAVDLQFLKQVAHGPCCLNEGLNTGTKAVDICAVQSDFAPGKCSPS